MYERLNKGELLNKIDLANEFVISEKTVQRDIDDLRTYFSEKHMLEEAVVKYDKSKKGYFLIRLDRECLTNVEILGLCKILLESRAFHKDEIYSITKKLLSQVVQNDRRTVIKLIESELYQYIPLQHNKKLLELIWEISQFINKQEIISFDYQRQDGKVNNRIVKPVTIMFSEYYFYLIAFMEDDSKDFPTIFRLDRISKLKGTNNQFYIPYKNKFNVGEFRKKVQFMYTGKLTKLKFEFNGSSIDSVLDRLPTAKIINKVNDKYVLEAEVYGNGIVMWLLSQGKNIKIISPVELCEKICRESTEILELYK